MGPYCMVESEDAISSDDVWNLVMERGTWPCPLQLQQETRWLTCLHGESPVGLECFISTRQSRVYSNQNGRQGY